MANDLVGDTFIPKGAASFKIDYEGPPKDFYFLLLPKMTLLAFSAAVEPLRIANQISNKELYRWFTMSEDGQPVQCSNLVTISANYPLQSIPQKANAFVCAGTEPIQAITSGTVQWLQKQRAFGVSVGGICTGAFALAKAGLLKSRTFTLHWENQPSFEEHFPTLAPTSNLYEIDGDLMTCGGGNASTDMMLHLIEADHGRELAMVVADMCIHSRSLQKTAPQKTAYSVVLGCRNKRLLSAIRFMEENLEEPANMEEVAAHVDTSRRQLERLFKKYAQMTPNQFYNGLRVSRAYAFLSETNLSVTEIAMATGFTSTDQFVKHFKAKHGVSPTEYRKGW